MNIWNMPSLELQPTVTLARWRVVRISLGEIQCDILLGWCVQSSCGRVSTPIVAFNGLTAKATTRSGRVYSLLGESAYDDDADYIFQSRFYPLLGEDNHLDVSQSYQENILK